MLVKEKVKYSWRKEEGGQERDRREKKIEFMNIRNSKNIYFE